MQINAKKNLVEINIRLMAEEAQYILDDLNSSEHQLYANTEEFRKGLINALKGCEDDEQ